jgi:predicted negative regulator of RcsB-dependent stress response
LPGLGARQGEFLLLDSLPKQIAAVGAVVFAFVAIGAIALLSQGSGSITSPEVEKKQYIVPKSRDNARGLASSDRKLDPPPKRSEPDTTAASITPNAEPMTKVTVPVASKTPKPSTPPSTVASIIAESFNANTAQEAMDMLAEVLAETQAPADASRLYSTMGALHFSQAEPDTAAGLDALENATEHAADAAQRSRAAVAEAAALVQHAEPKDGLERVDDMLESGGIDEDAVRQLTLIRGDLLVQTGDHQAAEAAYKRVREGGARGGPHYRQASLRLSRLYAHTGDERKQTAIEQEMKRAAAAR